MRHQGHLETLTIVGLGDSTTAGTPGFLSPLEAPPSGKGDEASQYAYWLGKAQPTWIVLNRGIDGQRSDQIGERMERDVLANKAHLAVVIAGVNDVYQGYSVEHVKQHLSNIYRTLTEREVMVVAGSILPYNEAGAEQVEKIEALNEWIRETSEAHPLMRFCDTHAAVSDPEKKGRLLSSPDGQHPDAEGYKSMAVALEPVIVELLDTCQEGRHHPTDGGPGVYKKTELTYNDYLQVPALLDLQRLRSENHDETLFIIIHQTYELWFKQIIHELESARVAMEQDEFLPAHHFVNRVVEIFRVLVQQIHILETMAPGVFLEFRDKLNPASGFQSLQFRELEFLAGLKDPRYLKPFKNRPDYTSVLERRLNERDLRQTLHALLLRTGYHEQYDVELPEEVEKDPEKAAVMRALVVLYECPHDFLPAYLLCESLLELDEYLTHWREHHVLMVERVIGFKHGTGGSKGVGYLEKTTAKRCFPYLWEVRTYLRKPVDFWAKLKGKPKPGSE